MTALASCASDKRGMNVNGLVIAMRVSKKRRSG